MSYRNHAWRHHPTKGTDPIQIPASGGALNWFYLYHQVGYTAGAVPNLYQAKFTHWRSNASSIFKPVSSYTGSVGADDVTTAPWVALRLLDPGAYQANYFVRFNGTPPTAVPTPATTSLYWDDYSANFVDIGERHERHHATDDTDEYWYALTLDFLTGDLDSGDNNGYVVVQFALTSSVPILYNALLVKQLSSGSTSGDDHTSWP